MKIFGIIVCFLFLILLSLSTGDANLNILDLLNYNKNIELKTILFDFRIPRTFAIITVGASLSLCGTILQNTLKNPLAEPYTLGFSGVANLLICIGILLGFQFNTYYISLFSILGGLLSYMCLYFLNKKIINYSNYALILSGIMISFFSSSLILILMNLFDPHQMQSAFYWMIGQFGTERDLGWPLSFLIFILSFTYLMKSHNKLDLLLLDHQQSKQIYNEILNFKNKILFICAILVAFSVSISGMLGFIGLLAPHMGFYLANSRRHKKVLPISCLIGSILLLISDIISQSINESIQLPTGSIVALIGIPFFIFLILKRKSYV